MSTEQNTTNNEKVKEADYCRRIVYERLWRMLDEMRMTKKELAKRAGVHPATLTKMGNSQNVTTKILAKICLALECKIEDVMEMRES